MTSSFISEEQIVKELKAAYRKLKSYYHYNKNYLIMRKKIAEFETDRNVFENTFYNLAKYLCNEKSDYSLNEKIDQIKPYFIPKKFKFNSSDSDSDNNNILNAPLPDDIVLESVNIFIDAPIEIYIIDTLWTIKANALLKNSLCQDSIYGNVLDSFKLYDVSESDNDEHLSFKEDNSLFHYYFYQYCDWKNAAIKCVESQHQLNNNTILVSLDIRRYYYSIEWSFDILNKYYSSSPDKLLQKLTSILEKTFFKNKEIIYKFRDNPDNTTKSPLPIGLFSSMLLANLYLLDYDATVKKHENVVYYGRYVDDLLFVISLPDGISTINNKYIKDLLTKDIRILDWKDGFYFIPQKYSLKINEKKIKILSFIGSNAAPMLKKLKEAEFTPSQAGARLTNINVTDFDEIYAIRGTSDFTKIRDMGNLSIDPLKLSLFLANNLRAVQDTESSNFKDKILPFFTGINACNYSSHWTNVLYYFVLSDDYHSWTKFINNINNAIDSIKADDIAEISNSNLSYVLSEVQRNLKQKLKIAIASSLALYPNFSIIKDEEYTLSIKLRNSNMFNHFIIRYPLITLSDKLSDNVDLRNVSNEDFLYYHSDNFFINSFKSYFSPFFIHMYDIFYHQHIYEMFTKLNKEQPPINVKDLDSREKSFHKIACEAFKTINSINSHSTEIPVFVYYYNTIPGIIQKRISCNYNDRFIFENKKSKIKIAIVNKSMPIDRCVYGLNTKSITKAIPADFNELMDLLVAAAKHNVNYIIFPEYYLYENHLTQVCKFVEKHNITVISGMTYLTSGNYALNRIVVIMPIHHNSRITAYPFFKEKNDYAPLEKRLLALLGYQCKDAVIPIVDHYFDGNIEFGTLLCYESTDILQRASYKHIKPYHYDNKTVMEKYTDILFIPEDNKDTPYFSSIIQSMVRDLYIYIAQSNNSEFGDSRISGPFSSSTMDILKVKGGEIPDILIGTVDIKELRDKRKGMLDELNKEIANYLNPSYSQDKRKEKIDKEKESTPKFKIPSART